MGNPWSAVLLSQSIWYFSALDAIPYPRYYFSTIWHDVLLSALWNCHSAGSQPHESPLPPCLNFPPRTLFPCIPSSPMWEVKSSPPPFPDGYGFPFSSLGSRAQHFNHTPADFLNSSAFLSYLISKCQTGDPVQRVLKWNYIQERVGTTLNLE